MYRRGGVRQDQIACWASATGAGIESAATGEGRSLPESMTKSARVDGSPTSMTAKESPERTGERRRSSAAVALQRHRWISQETLRMNILFFFV